MITRPLARNFCWGFFWKKCEPHAKSNGSQRAVSLYGVCIAHIHEGVISDPITGALLNLYDTAVYAGTL